MPRSYVACVAYEVHAQVYAHACASAALRFVHAKVYAHVHPGLGGRRSTITINRIATITNYY